MIRLENKEKENQIIDLYQNKKLSVRKIANQCDCSPDYITRVLKERGIYNFKNGQQSISRNWKNAIGMQWAAKCINSGKIFFDYKNQSGKLTKHIIDLYPDFKPIPGFKRRQQEKQTGKFWYEDIYFNIIEIPIIESDIPTKKCPYCDWNTIDITNKSGALTSHLRDVHNKKIVAYVQEFPDEIKLFKTFFDKLKHKEKVENIDGNFIVCKICNKKLTSLTNSSKNS